MQPNFLRTFKIYTKIFSKIQSGMKKALDPQFLLDISLNLFIELAVSSRKDIEGIRVLKSSNHCIS